MKKFITILLAIMLTASFAYAETDFSSMSNDDLLSLIDSARNELQARTGKEEEKVFLVDTDEIKIYLTGNISMNSYQMKIEVVFINNTDRKLSIHPDGCVVNGWEVNFGIIGETSPHAKAKDSFEIVREAAELNSVNDLESIRVTLRAFDRDTFENIQLGTVNLIYDGQNLIKVE